MSRTPRSALPDATSLRPSGPLPGWRMRNASCAAAAYSGAWTALGVKSSASVSSGWDVGPEPPQPASAATIARTARRRTRAYGRRVPLAEDVRAHCAAVAERAELVAIDLGAASYDGGVSGLDPELHRLDAPRDEVVRYVLILDAVNFGSGWFEELGTDTDAMTRGLTERGAPWTAAELRALEAAEVAETLGVPRDHELTRLYVRGLRELGAWLREPLELGDSAQAFAARAAVPARPGLPQAPADRRQRPPAGGRRGLRGRRSPHRLRRQPAAARAARGRRPHLRAGAGRAHRRGRGAPARRAGRGGAARLRSARLRGARARRRRPTAHARQLAVAPRAATLGGRPHRTRTTAY